MYLKGSISQTIPTPMAADAVNPIVDMSACYVSNCHGGKNVCEIPQLSEHQMWRIHITDHPKQTKVTVLKVKLAVHYLISSQETLKHTLDYIIWCS